ncbi:hypothetical protein HY639_00790 [Candidatus Woesearchaeota archaeon]|nr:hypothetical protein [Candidatus Woesearchaeota archaeon]
MKTWMTILFVLLLAVAPLAFADEQPENAEQSDDAQDTSGLDAMKAGIIASGTQFLAKIDAAISVGKEAKLDVAALEKLREEFSALLTSAEQSASKDDAKKLLNQLHSLADKVRAEAKRANLGSKARDVKSAADKALKEKKEELQKLEAAAAEARKKAILRQYEQHLEHAQKKLAKMKEGGLSTVTLEEKLKDFEAIKPELEKALESKEALKDALQKVHTAWQSLQKSFQDAEKQRAALHALKNAQELVVKMEKRADELRKAGKDTTELDKALQEFKSKIADAQKAAETKNFEGVKGMLKDARVTFAQLKKGYDTARKEKALEKVKEKLEKRTEEAEKKLEAAKARLEKRTAEAEKKLEAAKEKIEQRKKQLEKQADEQNEEGEEQ